MNDFLFIAFIACIVKIWASVKILIIWCQVLISIPILYAFYIYLFLNVENDLWLLLIISSCLNFDIWVVFFLCLTACAFFITESVLCVLGVSKFCKFSTFMTLFLLLLLFMHFWTQPIIKSAVKMTLIIDPLMVSA